MITISIIDLLLLLACSSRCALLHQLVDLGEGWSAILAMAATCHSSVAFTRASAFPRPCIARGWSVDVLEHTIMLLLLLLVSWKRISLTRCGSRA